MPSFGDPFSANVQRKLSKEELIQAIRLDIAGELEAIYIYDAHAMATDDPVAKAILEDIRDEEKVHIGELMTLLRILDPKEADLFLEGQQEVHELLAELKDGGTESKSDDSSADSGKPSLTVGSLIDQD